MLMINDQVSFISLLAIRLRQSETIISAIQNDIFVSNNRFSNGSIPDTFANSNCISVPPHNLD